MVQNLLADKREVRCPGSPQRPLVPRYPIPTIWGTSDVLDGSQAPQVGPGEGSVGVDHPPGFTGELGLPVTGKSPKAMTM